MTQKDVFLSSEGDAYYNRNRGGIDPQPDLISAPMLRLQIRPNRILEIGCFDGYRLRQLRNVFGSECHGIDPSAEAISAGNSKDIHLRVGTADKLDYADGFFDLVLFGFCVCLCDPQDHFQIAAEANRVLRDGGIIAIADFMTNRDYRNPWAHKPGLWCYKMEFAKMFTWHPGYRLLSRTYSEHAQPFTFDQNEAMTIDLIRKDFSAAFPTR
jgi:SAM-dependent methyltransferase